MDHGEILPNHDGTFQMSVDLDLSSVTPGDWRRYECVFQLSGVKDDIVTKLDKDVIRTNEGKTEIRGDEGGKHLFHSDSPALFAFLCVGWKVLFLLLSVSFI